MLASAQEPSARERARCGRSAPPSRLTEDEPGRGDSRDDPGSNGAPISFNDVVAPIEAEPRRTGLPRSHILLEGVENGDELAFLPAQVHDHFTSVLGARRVESRQSQDHPTRRVGTCCLNRDAFHSVLPSVPVTYLGWCTGRRWRRMGVMWRFAYRPNVALEASLGSPRSSVRSSRTARGARPRRPRGVSARRGLEGSRECGSARSPH